MSDTHYSQKDTHHDTIYIIRSFFMKAILFLLSLLPLSLSAQGLLDKYAHLLAAPRGYCAPKATGKITIDGRLDEADWKHAPHTERFVDIEGDTKPRPKYKTTVQMLWDEDYFYVAATLEEPNVVARLQQRDTIIWKENDFEVFIDPDNDGIDYYEFEVNARNTMMDLIITHPYRSGGEFIMPWDCPGLQHAIYVDGTLNNASDTDRGWTVEMAIPVRALRKNFGYTQGLTDQEPSWRVNFSRVQWLCPDHEENWVWSPTGRVDMHMPERWGFVSFVETLHDCASGELSPDYRLAWAVFYAQQDYRAQHGRFSTDLSVLGLTEADRNTLETETQISLEATSSRFVLRLESSDGSFQQVDERGHYTEGKSVKQVIT